MAFLFNTPKAPTILQAPIPPTKDPAVSADATKAAKEQTKARGQAATMLTSQTGLDSSTAMPSASRSLAGR